ncbi:hypothetical protein LCGC14_2835870, partial [marine sediment metagenome]
QEALPFAGSYQADEYRITAAGEVIGTSRLTLTRWPDDHRNMPITLPYAAATLKSAKFAGAPIEFEQTAQGQYEVTLPKSFVAPFDMTLEVTWKVPLEVLADERDPPWGPYRANLRSLIPAMSMSLEVVLDPDSGHGIVIFDPDTGDVIGIREGQQSTYPFTGIRGSGEYRQSFGSCSLCIDKAAPKDNKADDKQNAD